MCNLFGDIAAIAGNSQGQDGDSGGEIARKSFIIFFLQLALLPNYCTEPNVKDSFSLPGSHIYHCLGIGK